MKSLISIFLLFSVLSCSVFVPFKKRTNNGYSDEDSTVIYNYAFTEATKQKLFGNYSQALALLFKCIQVNPTSAAAFYLISEIYLKNNQKEKALEYCRLAAHFDSKNVWYNLELAKLYKINNKLDSSIYLYKKLVKKYPHNFNYKYTLAGYYFESEDYYKSLNIIKSLAKYDKKNEELALTKFQIERKLKKYRSAENTVKKIYKRMPRELKYLGLLAEHYKSIGKNKKAVKTYIEILKKDSTNEIAIIGLTNFYAETNEFNKAEIIINKNLLNDDIITDNELLFLINTIKIKGISDNCKNRIVGLIKNRVVKYKDEDIDIRNLVDVFINNGFSKDALDLLELFYNDFKNDKICDLYIMVLSQLDNNERVISITDKLIGEGNNNDYLFYYNGLSYYKKKLYKDALNSFIKGLNSLNDNRSYEEQFMILIGEAYYKLKDFNNAFDFFNKVLELNPYNLYVLNNYSYYLCSQGLNLEKAKEYSNRCILMDSKNFNYLDTYGWVLFNMGKYSEAYRVIKKAVDLGGNTDPNVKRHYNELLEMMNIKE